MKGYRTIILNGLVVLGTALATYLGTPEVQAALSSHAAQLTLGLSLLNIGLRCITTTPVGQPK